MGYSCVAYAAIGVAIRKRAFGAQVLPGMRSTGEDFSLGANPGIRRGSRGDRNKDQGSLLQILRSEAVLLRPQF